ncbi:MAG: DUF4215 domain-containing protein [archaeon]|nr:DUF4215 domain-containing protein [archaeon]
MKRKRVLRKKGLTPVVTTSLIIVSLIVAIGIVVVIIYNVIQSDIDVGEVSSVKLSIVENSVKINNDKSVSFNIERGTDGVDLTKIKFILSDGTESEELTAIATELKESESKEFKVSSKLFTQIKRISIIPIVKTKKGKETVLSVSDSIELNYLGNQVTIQKLSMICGNKKVEVGEECDDGNLVNKDGCSSQCKLESCLEQSGYICGEGKICPGTILKTNNLTQTCCNAVCSAPSKQNCSECGLICAKEDCYSILEECYFEGGWSNTCTSCSSITCDKYKTASDCNSDPCLKGCAWSLTTNKCEIKQNCGNDNVETGEQCDNGVENTNTVCVPSYSGSCSYCNTTCSLKTLAGASCGDGIKQEVEQCDNGTLNTNTACSPACGTTCYYCDTSCLTKSVVGSSCTKANGQTCTLGTECTSGNCYIDADNDGYTGSSGTKICKASASLGNDCLDSNANVHPGQTQYFAVQRGDGSFDYDCDENVNKKLSATSGTPGYEEGICNSVTSCSGTGTCSVCPDAPYHYIGCTYETNKNCGQMFIPNYCEVYSKHDSGCGGWGVTTYNCYVMGLGSCGSYYGQGIRYAGWTEPSIKQGPQTTCSCK